MVLMAPTLLVIIVVATHEAVLAFTNGIPPRRSTCRKQSTMLSDQESFQQGVCNEKCDKMKWIVRPATLDDYNATAKVLHESYSMMLPAAYNESVLQQALPAISTPQHELLTSGTWYVAQHPFTGEIVGCGGWTPQRPPGRRDVRKQLSVSDNRTDATNLTAPPHLRHFASTPTLARSGIGKALWERTLRDVTERCGPDTTLEVYSTLTARQFYRALGFVEVEELLIPLRGGACQFPAVLMRRHSGASAAPSAPGARK